jgi:hypothetical protein
VTIIIEKAQAGDARPATAGIPRLGFLLRHFGKWIALGHYGFPFSIGRYSSPVGRFRALARRSRFARRGRLARALAGTAMTLMWPFGAFSTALGVRAWMRTRGEAPNGVHVLLDMCWLALRHSIPPLEYALYRLDKAEQRENMHEYVYWNDLPGLTAMNARLGADNRDVQDKDRFAQICADNGFPHAATLAVFDRGRQIYPEATFAPNVPVIWTKSLRLSGGMGAAKWVKDGVSYRNAAGRRVSAAQLAEEFCKQDCIVQPFVENHSDIARVGNGALASLRIVTGMNQRGHAEFVTALLSLPHGDRETSGDGILCCVDRVSGRIRHAAFIDGEEATNHPDTGTPIVGIPLPYWRESIDLVLRAHAAAFPRFAFLGWDVALTEDGPLLLETNSGWGALFHQMFDVPLGHTAFSRLVAQYV